MEQLKSEQVSLSTLKRNLDSELSYLMRIRIDVPEYRERQREVASQVKDISSRLSKINKIIRDSDR